MRLSDFKAIVFDLDDTLYLERDYVTSGFRAVGHWLRHRRRWTDRATQRFVRDCRVELDSGRRGDIFDEVLRRLPGGSTDVNVSELVDAYRSHMPSIRLQPDADALLSELSGHVNIWIITDGPIVSQRSKVLALELASRVRRVIFTDKWGRAYWKPHSRAFQEVQTTAGVRPNQCIYIGDHPAKDFPAPRRLGWATARIRRPAGLHTGTASPAGCDADIELKSLWPILGHADTVLALRAA